MLDEITLKQLLAKLLISYPDKFLFRPVRFLKPDRSLFRTKLFWIAITNQAFN
jgi:hypothetical protein